MIVDYLKDIFKNLQNAKRIDLEDTGETRKRSWTVLEESNELHVLIENIKKVSDQLAAKIENAVENETFPPKASNLFEAILKGVGATIQGFEESHKALDSSQKELDEQKEISTDQMIELKIKLDQERQKTRLLTDSLVELEKEQKFYEGERMSLFEEIQKLEVELERAIRARSFTNHMLDSTLELVKKKQEDLMKSQKEARVLRNHKKIQEMSFKFAKQRTQDLPHSNRNSMQVYRNSMQVYRNSMQVVTETSTRKDDSSVQQEHNRRISSLNW